MQKQQLKRTQHQPTTTPLIDYVPSAHHDILVMNTYVKMVEQEDLYNILPDGALSSFFLSLQPPSHAHFKVDDTGQIWFLAWTEHNSLLGRLYALWADRAKRQSRETLVTIAESISGFLATYNELVAITWQPHVVEGAVKLGYNVIGKFEGMAGKSDRWILHIRRGNGHATNQH